MHNTSKHTQNTTHTPRTDEVILPIRMAQHLGCHSALITNAAGGINPGFRAGDLMLLEDHINLSEWCQRLRSCLQNMCVWCIWQWVVRGRHQPGLQGE